MQETLSWKFEDKESYKWCLEFRAALSGVKALLYWVLILSQGDRRGEGEKSESD